MRKPAKIKEIKKVYSGYVIVETTVHLSHSTVKYLCQDEKGVYFDGLNGSFLIFGSYSLANTQLNNYFDESLT